MHSLALMMKIERLTDDQFAIFVNESEMMTFVGCLNEVCNGIHISEFETRLGATMEDVSSMLDTLLAALRAAPDGTNT